MRLFTVLCLALTLAAPLAGLAGGIDPYQRSSFGSSWRDADGDCQNTRQELLISLSASAPKLSKSGCRVLRGNWYDPYTNREILSARELEIDHIVPLKWAWTHGASDWSKARRVRFANDPRFIVPVTTSQNRSKGAKSPLEWLPPNARYQCQYVLRFSRAIRIYHFALSPSERADYNAVRANLCAAPS